MNLSNGLPMMGSTGEIILFACTAIVMVACALGVLFCKKAAHSVICMVGVMLGLAVLYIGTSDDYARQSRGAIVAAVLGGLGLIVIVTTAILKSVPATYAANEVNPYSNEPITDLAITLFQEHWLSMELAGGLLITAAVGAMLLTHSDRLGPKVTQLQTARNKMRAFGEKGARIGQLPAHDRRGHPRGLRAARPRPQRGRRLRGARGIALHHRAHARRPALRLLRDARRRRAHRTGPASGSQGAHHHPH